MVVVESGGVEGPYLPITLRGGSAARSRGDGKQKRGR